MERRDQLTLLKNAFANVLRGSTAALVALFLPPFLTRAMSTETYGAWSLILQLSAWVGLLDFGLQTAVGRFVAHASERGDTKERNQIVSTAFGLLSGAAVAGLLGALLIVAFLRSYFHRVPTQLGVDARLAFLVIAVSLAVGLPANVFNGIFIGMQRNEIPAATVGGSRIFSAFLLVLVARHGGSLTRMGVCVAAVNLASYVLQYAVYRRLRTGVRLSWELISRKTSRKLLDYSFSLAVWSFAMLVISGLDLTLVGFFQFEAVAYYAVASILVTFLVGLQNALFSAMISPAAVLHARGDSKALGHMVVTATRYGTFLLLALGLPLIFGAKSLLTLWVGGIYASRASLLLQILVTANIIRNLFIPYAMALIGSGQQRLIIISPLVEGGVNLVTSIVAGRMFGAVGVAGGTLVGALVVAVVNFFYNMPRTQEVKFTVGEYLRDGVLRPLVCAAPIFVSAVVSHFAPGYGDLPRVVIWGLTLTATLLCVWNWGLLDTERQKLRLELV